MKTFCASSLGIIMMLAASNVLAVERPCPGVTARFEQIAPLDGSRWGVFSVRNGGATVIRFLLGGVVAKSSRMELHPLSYNIHSQLPGSADWLPDMTIGTFDQPKGLVDLKGGESADLYVDVDQVFDDRYPPGTSFFVKFRAADSKCSVRSGKFQRG